MSQLQNCSLMCTKNGSYCEKEKRERGGGGGGPIRGWGGGGGGSKVWGRCVMWGMGNVNQE